MSASVSWIDRMAEECARSSQKAVADRIGYSATVVNQLLKGKYKGDLVAIEAAFRGAYMRLTVECPVLGTLPANECLEHQKLPFAATNPQRVRLFRACRECKHRRH